MQRLGKVCAISRLLVSKFVGAGKEAKEGWGKGSGTKEEEGKREARGGGDTGSKEGDKGGIERAGGRGRKVKTDKQRREGRG